jgi:geranylgeranyl diphosphate synthase type II
LNALTFLIDVSILVYILSEQYFLQIVRGMAMSTKLQIENALLQVLQSYENQGGPVALSQAIRHAVMPGGARIRPQLCLAVAHACGMDDPAFTMGVAVALELLHCGSLVHDDLPCFDNAEVRRGVASVQAAFGERLAVLTGDALIVMAFEALVQSSQSNTSRLAPVMKMIAQGVGAPHGIIAGQAWECEAKVNLNTYQKAKTGALFSAATAAGAACAGANPLIWSKLGENLGEAYQVADDIRDVLGDIHSIGKPVGKDVALDRPSATRQFGLDGAVAYFDELVARAIDSIPHCPGQELLQQLVLSESERLVPNALYDRLQKERVLGSQNSFSV